MRAENVQYFDGAVVLASISIEYDIYYKIVRYVYQVEWYMFICGSFSRSLVLWHAAFYLNLFELLSDHEEYKNWKHEQKKRSHIDTEKKKYKSIESRLEKKVHICRSI